MSELLDNTRTRRIAALKHIVSRLHEGADPAEVRAQLKDIVRECDAAEIVQMEQELLAEGIPLSQIIGMCDLHSSLAREVLAEQPQPLLPAWHPVKTLQRENEAMERTISRLRLALAEVAGPGAEEARRRVRALCNELMDVEKHYARKEHLLFPMLERHGITGPSQVMWAKHDEVRRLLADLRGAISEPQWCACVGETARRAIDAIIEMIAKEERILLPLSLRTLADQEWTEIWEQSPQFGWCLVEPDPARPPQAARAQKNESASLSLNLVPAHQPAPDPAPGAVLFPAGALTREQLLAIFSTLPVDLTFVDADDRVRFFSEGPDRVFVRPKAVIGRMVQHCHPPESVHLVERILGDFRAGRRHVAEFWIELRQPRTRFVHIRYFALRDEGGGYLGTLEVTQDLTRERTLTGERRLLQDDQT